MKRYYSKYDAPLAFHKFFWYVSLPIGFLLVAARMIYKFSEIETFNWLYAVDIGYCIITLTLRFVCFVGFFRWKSYAWYSVIIYLCFEVLNSIFTFIDYALYTSDQIGTAVGQLLSFLIYSVLVSIYYVKRKPLFFANTIQVVTEMKPNLINKESSESDI